MTNDPVNRSADQDETEASEAKIDISTLIASSIHDMKNSLTMLLGTLAEVTNQCPPDNCQSFAQLAKVQIEGQRVNRDLIQLLALYRIDRNEYNLNIDYHNICHLLEEIYFENQEILAHNNIELTFECNESLAGYIDRELVRGVLNTVIHNAHQYTQDRIMLMADKQADDLVISVLDNGDGYPAAMLAGDQQPARKGVDFETGSTGLGLYFARQVATLHQNGERQGRVALSNQGLDGGGRFSLHLP